MVLPREVDVELQCVHSYIVLCSVCECQMNTQPNTHGMRVHVCMCMCVQCCAGCVHVCLCAHVVMCVCVSTVHVCAWFCICA